MAQKQETIQLKNIHQGVGNTRMAKWKYELYKEAILGTLPAQEPGLPFKELIAQVKQRLPQDKSIGSVSWHVTSVKLDLEARGLIRRIPGAKPQRLVRGSNVR